MKKLVVLVMAMALVGVLAACAPGASADPAAPSQEVDDGSYLAGTMGTSGPYDAAEVMTGCKFAIREQLKAPSTARFPGLFSGDFTEPQYMTVVNFWVWYVRVDAQNSFGAMIRNHFKCLVRANGDIELTLMD